MYNSQRTNVDSSETILTTSNVNSTQFGKLFTQNVDGYIFAHPLYVSGLMINGAVHNVIFVATEHDSVYAFDADSNAGADALPLWHTSFLSTNVTSVPTGSVNSTDINPEVGITGTPVIDLSTKTMYVVAETLEGGTNYVKRLHALDITTGLEETGSPVVISASVPGTGNGSSGGTLNFDTQWENQRGGLLFYNGVVYIPFASHGDNSDWHGWILGYSTSNLQRVFTFCSTPNAYSAGIWMAGEGLPMDSGSNLFLSTGNGTFDTTVNPPVDYGDSILRFDLSQGSAVQDYFTPSDQNSLDSGDTDLGSGGVLVLPDQPGTYPQLLVEAGKEGNIYVVNRDIYAASDSAHPLKNMGHFSSSSDGIVQELDGAVGGMWATPVYFNGKIYFGGSGDNLKAFTITNGLLSTSPTDKSPASFGFPGMTPTISASGTSNGVLWVIDASAFSDSGAGGPEILRAFNPSSLSNGELYDSSMNSSRDAAGGAIKFQIPLIDNGKVYVGAEGQLNVYGLLGSVSQVAKPSILPGTETFSGTLPISISDSTSGSAIYYTTDGSTPSPGVGTTKAYAGSFNVTATTTVSAIATEAGFTNSAVASATYTLQQTVATPVISPGSETFTGTLPVSISDSTSGSAIYYTTDGSTPSPGVGTTKAYAGSFNVTATTTVKAIATESGFTNSAVASATYTLQQQTVATPVISPAPGTYTNSVPVSISDSTSGSAIYYTTDGSTPSPGVGTTKAFTSSFTLTSSATVKAMATESGFTNSAIATSAYTIQSQSSGLINFSAGFTTTSGLQFNGNAVWNQTTTHLHLTDGAAHDQAGSVYFTTPVNVQSFTNDFSFQLTGTAPLADGFTFILQNSSATALGSNGGGLGYGPDYPGGSPVGIPTSVAIKFDLYNNAGEGTDSTGLYTNGASPSMPATDLTSSGINLHSGDVMNVHMTYDGTTLTMTITDPTANKTFTTSWTVNIPSIVGGNTALVGFTAGEGWYDANQDIISWSYSSGGTQSQVATPVISPSSETFSGTLPVSISDSTSGSAIYYTTDGSTPSPGVGTTKAYGGSFNVTATTTVSAIATEAGFTNSAIASATYTLQQTVATPAITPSGETFSGTLPVSISDSTSGSAIYYTTDGSTPSPGVGTTKAYAGSFNVTATTTVKAIATEAGFTNSAVASATYTLQQTVATPVISPGSETFTGTLPVSISDSTSGSAIYYTTDGSTPSPGVGTTKAYAGSFNVTATTTVKAIATESGFTNSAVASATYTLQQQTVATPVISPAPGTYTNSVPVSISDSTSGAAIYYTTDGSTPSPGVGTTKAFTSSFTLTSSATVKAIATEAGFTNSAIATSAYTIQSQSSGLINFSAGFTTTSGLQFNGNAVWNQTTTHLHLTDGAAHDQAGSVYFTTPVNVQSFTNDFSFQLTGTAPLADGFTFILQNSSATALGSNGGGLGYGPDYPGGSPVGIPTSVAIKFDLYNNAGEGTDSTGLYTNGASPSMPATDLTSSGINLHSGDVMNVHMTYDGTTLTMTITDPTANKTFTTSWTVNIPSIVGGNTALVGFTAGEGWYDANQDIISWSYTAP